MQKYWVGFADLERIVGREKAEELCADFGGRALYIPVADAEDHLLMQRLGLRLFRKLRTRYGGTELFLPNGLRNIPKKKEILKRLGQGEQARSIAVALNVTERWVRRVAAGRGAENGLREPPA